MIPPQPVGARDGPCRGSGTLDGTCRGSPTRTPLDGTCRGSPTRTPLDGTCRGSPTRTLDGFTLIELLAVVAIFALLAAVALPDFSLRGARAAMDQAKQLAATFEFARQRAVMTGTPHRVALDLEGGRYRIESQATDVDSGAAPDLTRSWAEEEILPLTAPVIEEPVYRALSGPVGRAERLSDDVRFSTVELPEGPVASGEVTVTFDRDGTSGYTEVWLLDPDGSSIVLTVEPLADHVRVSRP